MGNKVYKARSLKGVCEVCGKYIKKGNCYSTTGSDGHGALCGLTHKDCDTEFNVRLAATVKQIRKCKHQ